MLDRRKAASGGIYAKDPDEERGTPSDPSVLRPSLLLGPRTKEKILEELSPTRRS